MKIKEGNTIINIWAFQAEKAMDSKKIHLTNSKMIFIKTKAEFIMRHIHQARQEEEKDKILLNK